VVLQVCAESNSQAGVSDLNVNPGISIHCLQIMQAFAKETGYHFHLQERHKKSFFKHGDNGIAVYRPNSSAELGNFKAL
jgi:hypothetical protein